MLKILFIGLGSIGSRHIKNVVAYAKRHNKNVQIDALRSGEHPLRDGVLDCLHTQYFAFSDVPEDYDIVFITNPTSFHFDMIKQAVNKGKNMFIEKPLFETTDYCLEDIEFKPDGIYYVACPMRHLPILKYVKQFCKKHQVYSARAITSSYLPEWRKGVDYRKVYSAKKELGGGVTLDLIHEWDYLVWLFGMPEEFYNFNGHYSHLEIDSDDLSVYIARYQDKLVEVHLDYIGRETVRMLELYCKDTVLYADFIANTITFAGPHSECIHLPEEDEYTNEIEYFFDLLEGKEKNCNDVYHAYEVLQLILEKNRKEIKYV